MAADGLKELLPEKHKWDNLEIPSGELVKSKLPENYQTDLPRVAEKLAARDAHSPQNSTEYSHNDGSAGVVPTLPRRPSLDDLKTALFDDIIIERFANVIVAQVLTKRTEHLQHSITEDEREALAAKVISYLFSEFWLQQAKKILELATDARRVDELDHFINDIATAFIITEESSRRKVLNRETERWSQRLISGSPQQSSVRRKKPNRVSLDDGSERTAVSTRSTIYWGGVDAEETVAELVDKFKDKLVDFQQESQLAAGEIEGVTVSFADDWNVVGQLDSNNQLDFKRDYPMLVALLWHKQRQLSGEIVIQKVTHAYGNQRNQVRITYTKRNDAPETCDVVISDEEVRQFAEQWQKRHEPGRPVHYWSQYANWQIKNEAEFAIPDPREIINRLEKYSSYAINERKLRKRRTRTNRNSLYQKLFTAAQSGNALKIFKANEEVAHLISQEIHMAGHSQLREIAEVTLAAICNVDEKDNKDNSKQNKSKNIYANEYNLLHDLYRYKRSYQTSRVRRFIIHKDRLGENGQCLRAITAVEGIVSGNGSRLEHLKTLAAIKSNIEQTTTKKEGSKLWQYINRYIVRLQQDNASVLDASSNKYNVGDDNVDCDELNETALLAVLKYWDVDSSDELMLLFADNTLKQDVSKICIFLRSCLDDNGHIFPGSLKFYTLLLAAKAGEAEYTEANDLLKLLSVKIKLRKGQWKSVVDELLEAAKSYVEQDDQYYIKLLEQINAFVDREIDIFSDSPTKATELFTQLISNGFVDIYLRQIRVAQDNAAVSSPKLVELHSNFAKNVLAKTDALLATMADDKTQYERRDFPDVLCEIVYSPGVVAARNAVTEDYKSSFTSLSAHIEIGVNNYIQWLIVTRQITQLWFIAQGMAIVEFDGVKYPAWQSIEDTLRGALIEILSGGYDTEAIQTTLVDSFRHPLERIAYHMKAVIEKDERVAAASSRFEELTKGKDCEALQSALRQLIQNYLLSLLLKQKKHFQSDFVEIYKRRPFINVTQPDSNLYDEYGGEDDIKWALLEYANQLAEDEFLTFLQQSWWQESFPELIDYDDFIKSYQITNPKIMILKTYRKLLTGCKQLEEGQFGVDLPVSELAAWKTAHFLSTEQLDKLEKYVDALESMPMVSAYELYTLQSFIERIHYWKANRFVALEDAGLEEHDAVVLRKYSRYSLIAIKLNNYFTAVESHDESNQELFERAINVVKSLSDLADSSIERYVIADELIYILNRIVTVVRNRLECESGILPEIHEQLIKIIKAIPDDQQGVKQYLLGLLELQPNYDLAKQSASLGTPAHYELIDHIQSANEDIAVIIELLEKNACWTRNEDPLIQLRSKYGEENLARALSNIANYANDDHYARFRMLLEIQYKKDFMARTPWIMKRLIMLYKHTYYSPEQREQLGLISDYPNNLSSDVTHEIAYAQPILRKNLQEKSPWLNGEGSSESGMEHLERANDILMSHNEMTEERAVRIKHQLLYLYLTNRRFRNTDVQYVNRVKKTIERLAPAYRAIVAEVENNAEARRRAELQLPLKTTSVAPLLLFLDELDSNVEQRIQSAYGISPIAWVTWRDVMVANNWSEMSELFTIPKAFKEIVDTIEDSQGISDLFHCAVKLHLALHQLIKAENVSEIQAAVSVFQEWYDQYISVIKEYINSEGESFVHELSAEVDKYLAYYNEIQSLTVNVDESYIHLLVKERRLIDGLLLDPASVVNDLNLLWSIPEYEPSVFGEFYRNLWLDVHEKIKASLVKADGVLVPFSAVIALLELMDERGSEYYPLIVKHYLHYVHHSTSFTEACENSNAFGISQLVTLVSDRELNLSPIADALLQKLIAELDTLDVDVACEYLQQFLLNEALFEGMLDFIVEQATTMTKQQLQKLAREKFKRLQSGSAEDFTDTLRKNLRILWTIDKHFSAEDFEQRRHDIDSLIVGAYLQPVQHYLDRKYWDNLPNSPEFCDATSQENYEDYLKAHGLDSIGSYLAELVNILHAMGESFHRIVLHETLANFHEQFGYEIPFYYWYLASIVQGDGVGFDDFSQQKTAENKTPAPRKQNAYEATEYLTSVFKVKAEDGEGRAGRELKVAYRDLSTELVGIKATIEEIQHEVDLLKEKISSTRKRTEANFYAQQTLRQCVELIKTDAEKVRTLVGSILKKQLKSLGATKHEVTLIRAVVDASINERPVLDDEMLNKLFNLVDSYDEQFKAAGTDTVRKQLANDFREALEPYVPDVLNRSWIDILVQALGELDKLSDYGLWKKIAKHTLCQRIVNRHLRDKTSQAAQDEPANKSQGDSSRVNRERSLSSTVNQLQSVIASTEVLLYNLSASASDTSFVDKATLQIRSYFEALSSVVSTEVMMAMESSYANTEGMMASLNKAKCVKDGIDEHLSEAETKLKTKQAQLRKLQTEPDRIYREQILPLHITNILRAVVCLNEYAPGLFAVPTFIDEFINAEFKILSEKFITETQLSKGEYGSFIIEQLTELAHVIETVGEQLGANFDPRLAGFTMQQLGYIAAFCANIRDYSEQVKEDAKLHSEPGGGLYHSVTFRKGSGHRSSVFESPSKPKPSQARSVVSSQEKTSTLGV